jgi:hypothetical protein
MTDNTVTSVAEETTTLGISTTRWLVLTEANPSTEWVVDDRTYASMQIKKPWKSNLVLALRLILDRRGYRTFSDHQEEVYVESANEKTDTVIMMLISGMAVVNRVYTGRLMTEPRTMRCWIASYEVNK